MNLSDRLQYWDKINRAKTSPKNSEAWDTSLTEFLEGERVSNAFGEYLLIEKNFKENYRAGKIYLNEILDIEPEIFSQLSLSNPIPNLNLDKTIFLDIETTGLSGGSGTYPFLIGIGFFQDGKFCLRQFFMPDYSKEKAMLSDLTKLLKDYENLVTFNGKGYDIPILNGRFILQRIKPNFESQSHLDLLFPSRRFWKKRLKNCSLLNLEREILGIERVMDIPGYLIPQVYFDYLKDGKAEQLKLVLEHNRYDILAMVGLLAQLGKILQEPEKLEILHSEDWVCLSRHYFYAGDLARARTCGEKAVQKNSRDEIYTEVNLHLGKIYKKLAEWDKAERLWHNLLLENSGFRLEPYLELAKLYEHKLKDFRKAINLVEKVISNVNTSISNNFSLESLYYRKQRLLRKIELNS
ncbi:MAG: hypothetical protein RBG1_1C00001G0990 [candidate division Zixibacteria bacterium RBG-1]|nr:MAG: hypothetical protein RBG1_1C00001G0990 [candidate division Zixibacteria bacterium RBG-1]OGC83734.1 MAG: hypothetical protein A2V73_02160 [candidate division Zixibacteria bacterium RBG_19FT_COMBO_42_43]